MNSQNYNVWASFVSVIAVAMIVGLFVFGFSTIKRVNQINDSWSAYSEKEATVNHALARLKGDIGYGGFIHNFKNYVLRHNAIYKTRAQTNIAEMLGIIDALAPHLAAGEEREALSAIKGVVLNYGEMLAVSGEMVAEGRSTWEIDSIVKVNDKPALDAFAYLLELSESHNREMKAQADFELQSTIKFLSFGIFLALGVAGTAVFVLIFIRKIAAANAAVTLAYDRIDLLFDSAPDPMISVRPDGSIAKYNAQAETFFGYTQAEVARMTVEDFMPESFREKHTSYRAKYMQSPKYRTMGAGLELVARTKDGRQPFTEISLSHSGEGNEALITITMRDITERKRNEQAMLLAKEETEKAARLEVALKSEREYSALQEKFVSLVSHEFRTPLAIIDSSVQRIIRLRDKITPDQLVERGNKIRFAVERMVGLIETTLYASRLDADKVEINIQPSNIRELISEICERQAEISPNHDIRIDLGDIPEHIDADPRLLEHIFTNLLSNTVKYAPGNPLIEVCGKVDDGIISVAVKDEGLGISEDDLAHISKRFFRAKTAEGINGTGLGLSVSKEFVEMHGGTIEVASVEGEGSTFTVELPIQQPAPPNTDART